MAYFTTFGLQINRTIYIEFVKHLSLMLYAIKLSSFICLECLPSTCKRPIQNYLEHNYIISEPIFTVFVAYFTTFGLQIDLTIVFYCHGGGSEIKERFWKMQFLKDGVQKLGLRA